MAIRSNGFMFSSDGLDLVSGRIDEEGDINVRFHQEDEWVLFAAEVRELAAALIQLADEADPPEPAPMSYFPAAQPSTPYPVEAPQPQVGPLAEHPMDRLNRLLRSQGFDVVG